MFALPQESAHCLALIVNELVTNSIKHGTEGGAGAIRIALERGTGSSGWWCRTTARDIRTLDSLPRSSGLTLMRGLCRQIGAALELGQRRRRAQRRHLRRGVRQRRRGCRGRMPARPDRRPSRRRLDVDSDGTAAST